MNQYALVVIMSFTGLIVVGTLFLMMPFSTPISLHWQLRNKDIFA